MTAAVRFFALVGPMRSAPRSWTNRAYEYLTALRSAGVAVRALTIGRVYFNRPRNPAWRDWLTIRSLFATALGTEFINVVCVPTGHPLGRRTTRAELAGRLRVPLSEAEGKEVVYDPSTALVALHTDGHRNVAITGGRPEPREAEALTRYDLVVAPDASEAEQLRAAGVASRVATPAEFPALLEAA